jgi:hypothetical protein
VVRSQLVPIEVKIQSAECGIVRFAVVPVPNAIFEVDRADFWTPRLLFAALE